MDTLDTIRAFIRKKLHQNQMTMQTFAEQSGMSESGISMFLQGKRGLSIEKLEGLAHACQMEPWQLLEKAAKEKDYPPV